MVNMEKSRKTLFNEIINKKILRLKDSKIPKTSTDNPAEFDRDPFN